MEAGNSGIEQISSNHYGTIKQEINPNPNHNDVEVLQHVNPNDLEFQRRVNPNPSFDSTKDMAIQQKSSSHIVYISNPTNYVISTNDVIKDRISTTDVKIGISSGSERKYSRLAGVYDFCTAASVVVSSVLYLADVATTVLAARSYRSFDRRAGYTGPNGAFTAIICMMVTAHVLNAVIFWLTLPKEEQPLKQAYFFPLIQLWRLWTVLRSGFRGRLVLDESIHSSVIKPTYYILAASLEAAPQLFLQAFVLLGPNSVLTARAVTRDSVFIYLSILACILNAAYNGAIAVRLVSRDSPTWQGSLAMALAGGLYVSASMLLRCQGLMITALAPFTHSHYHRKLILPAFFFGIVTNFTHFIFLLRSFKHRQNLSVRRWLLRAVECLALSGASYTVGPLYAMLKLDNKYNNSDTQIGTVYNGATIMSDLDSRSGFVKNRELSSDSITDQKALSTELITHQSPRRWTFYVHLVSACTTHLIVDMALAGIFLYLRSRQSEWHVDVCRESKLIVWRCSQFFHIFAALLIAVILSVTVHCVVEIRSGPAQATPPLNAGNIPQHSGILNSKEHHSVQLHPEIWRSAICTAAPPTEPFCAPEKAANIPRQVEESSPLSVSSASLISASSSSSSSSWRSLSLSKKKIKEQELPMLPHMACS